MKDLKGQQTRIMNALRKTINPVDTSRDTALAASMAIGAGAPSYLEAREGVNKLRQEQRVANVQPEVDIYNMMKEQASAGQAEAASVDKAITDIVGDDPELYTQILSDLHNDPENVDSGNVRAKAMKYAADRGIVPLAIQKAKTDIGKTKADTEKTRADILKTYKELQEPSKIEQERIKAEQAKELEKEKLREELPDLETKAEDSIRQLNELIGNSKKGIPRHPGFSAAVGFGGQKLVPFYGAGDLTQPGGGFTSGSDAADFAERVKQIKGKQFLEAYNQLKGGGQITEVEGAKAESALSRMSLAQSEKEFVAAVKEFRGAIEKGLQRARQKANADNNTADPLGIR